MICIYFTWHNVLWVDIIIHHQIKSFSLKNNNKNHLHIVIYVAKKTTYSV